YEFGKPGIHIVVVRRAAVDLLPAAAHRVELGNLLDVHFLVRAHRCAGLVHGDRHFLALVDLHEYHGGSHAAEIHGGAGPVEQYGFDGAAVRASIRKRHDACSPQLSETLGNSHSIHETPRLRPASGDHG